MLSTEIINTLRDYIQTPISKEESDNDDTHSIAYRTMFYKADAFDQTQTEPIPTPHNLEAIRPKCHIMMAIELLFHNLNINFNPPMKCISCNTAKTNKLFCDNCFPTSDRREVEAIVARKFDHSSMEEKLGLSIWSELVGVIERLVQKNLYNTFGEGLKNCPICEQTYKTTGMLCEECERKFKN